MLLWDGDKGVSRKGPEGTLWSGGNIELFRDSGSQVYELVEEQRGCIDMWTFYYIEYISPKEKTRDKHCTLDNNMDVDTLGRSAPVFLFALKCVKQDRCLDAS